jgi:hypothetical protein
MYKSSSLPVIVVALSLSFGVMFACKKEKAPAAAGPKDYSFKMGFDTMAKAYRQDWAFVNNSVPQGAGTWRQGVFEAGKGITGFPAHTYEFDPKEYAYNGFSAGAGLATINSWMITPSVPVKNGDKFIFWTRTMSTVTYPDRMQVRANFNNDGLNVGFGAGVTNVGDFNTLLFDINPTLLASGAGSYPTTWTKYEYTVSGLPISTPRRARFAFRYLVTNGGPSGANSDGVGVDDVEFISVK